MKWTATFISLVLGINALIAQDTPSANDSFYTLAPVEVRAVRAGVNQPFTHTNLGKKELARLNAGQDIPYLLNQTPSVIVNSDAGNGIGYTGLRIRGTDATRINVTLNGIPYNDAESQGTFFVDMPDVASSLQSVQVQRGVGTSSNGAGAFGATVSLSTNDVIKDAYAEMSNSYGSFNSWKNTIKLGTGLVNNHFTVDARLSRISSDGYVDRAWSKLHSLYLSTAWLGNYGSLRFNTILGKEITYQAWNGVAQSMLKSNRTYNMSGMDKPGEPYKNEVDNYGQNHYQLFYNWSHKPSLVFNTAVFLTNGQGFYENYKAQQKYSRYGLTNPVINGIEIKKTDLVRQKWLNNNFYGQIFSLLFKQAKTNVQLGGGWNVYDGIHHGNIIWATYGIDNDFQYYHVNAIKKDQNIFGKWQYDITPAVSFFTDVQYRHVSHTMNGFMDNPLLVVSRNFNFINPKIGVSYSQNHVRMYASYAVAGKEPNRDDYEANANEQPLAERLYDIEAAVEYKTVRYNWNITLYNMNYKNQLVLTGKINDVGAYTRTNVPKSYRRGVELQAGYKVCKSTTLSANLSMSNNRIVAFNEYLDTYDSNWNWIKQSSVKRTDTKIAFSPQVIGGASLNYTLAPNFELSLFQKYVGKQYLDNSQSDAMKLDAYTTTDLRIISTLKKTGLKEVAISAWLNNIFNKKYEANGYTYSYLLNGVPTADNYYFPMAGINFMLGVSIKL